MLGRVCCLAHASDACCDLSGLNEFASSVRASRELPRLPWVREIRWEGCCICFACEMTALCADAASWIAFVAWQSRLISSWPMREGEPSEGRWEHSEPGPISTRSGEGRYEWQVAEDCHGHECKIAQACRIASPPLQSRVNLELAFEGGRASECLGMTERMRRMLHLLRMRLDCDVSSCGMLDARFAPR